MYLKILSKFQPRLYVVGKRSRANLPKYNKLKNKKIHVIRQLIIFFFLLFAPLGFGIAQYINRHIIEKKK